jgi:hypothetical protein
VTSVVWPETVQPIGKQSNDWHTRQPAAHLHTLPFGFNWLLASQHPKGVAGNSCIHPVCEACPVLVPVPVLKSAGSGDMSNDAGKTYVPAL